MIKDTGSVRVFSALGPFSGRLDELLQAFVIDVGRRPLRHLIPGKVMSELHDVRNLDTNQRGAIRLSNQKQGNLPITRRKHAANI